MPKYTHQVTLKYLTQYKSKKSIKESLETSNETLRVEGEEYIDIKKLETKFNEILTKYLDECDFGVYKDMLYDYIEDYAWSLVESTARSMKKYCNMSNKSISGNFAKIDLDYEDEHNDKKFDDVIEKIKKGVKDTETDEFREWSIGCFFYAFGAFGITYNFGEFCTEITSKWDEE